MRSEPLTRCHQIALAALQGSQQLILGHGNELQVQLAAVAGMALEILTNGPQTLILKPDSLPPDLGGAVTALVDQYAQLATLADFGKIALPYGGRQVAERTQPS